MPSIRIMGPSGPAEIHHVGTGTLLVGRDETCGLCLNDPTLSREHVELCLEDGRWTATDRGSSNGTKINGVRIVTVTRLLPGDEIRIGDSRLWVDGDSTPDHQGKPARPTLRSRGDDSPEEPGPPSLIGSSPAMVKLRHDVEKAAASDLTVLVSGPTGTGKELVAWALHDQSPRRDGPFIVVNCPALPANLVEAELFGILQGVATDVAARPGRLAQADGGTIFLDEVGDLDLSAQAKLLRFLETKIVEPVGSSSGQRVDARVVSATHHELLASIEDGHFRRDLYHRLNGISLRTPALSERRADIPRLVHHFLSLDHAAQLDIDEEAMARLEAAEWSGNVRELRQAIDRAAVFCEGGHISLQDLPEQLRRAAASDQRLWTELVERGGDFWQLVRDPFLNRTLGKSEVRAFIQRAHQEGGGSYKGAAELLGLGDEHKRFLNFLNRHGLGINEG